MTDPVPCPCRSGQAFDDCHGAEGGRWETVKVVAGVLAVTEDTVIAYAARDYDPLPLRVDHAGRRYISKQALASWVNRQDLPFHAWVELERVERLPGQRRRAGESNRRPHRDAAESKVARRRRPSAE